MDGLLLPIIYCNWKIMLVLMEEVHFPWADKIFMSSVIFFFSAFVIFMLSYIEKLSERVSFLKCLKQTCFFANFGVEFFVRIKTKLSKLLIKEGKMGGDYTTIYHKLKNKFLVSLSLWHEPDVSQQIKQV